MAKQRTKRFRLVNLGGGMNTVAEDNDVISLDPNAQLGIGFSQVRTEFRDIKNWYPINRGGLSKAFGTSLYKACGAGTITGLYRFIKSDGTSLFLVGQTTSLYKLVSGTLTSLYASFSSNAYLHFETAYDKCIICDGVTAPQTFDGTTVAALGGSPPTGARQSLFYQNRLFIFGGTSNPSLLYYSDAGNISAGYSGNFINCDVNDGQKITCITKFFIPGQLEPVIIVGKERSVGIVTGTGTASDPYTFTKITFNMGIPGFRQAVQFNDDVAFLTPRGVNSYKTTVQNKNLESDLLSQNVYDQFTGLSSTYLPNAMCWEDWKQRRISFAVPVSTSAYPNRIWHYDIDQQGWYYQDGFNITSAFVDTDGTVYMGDNSGDIFYLDETVYAYRGSAINASLTTGFMDFFEPILYKQIVWASATIRGQGSYGLGVSTRLDFGTQVGSTHTIDISTGAYTWNGGVWTSDDSVYQWGGPPLITKIFYPSGIFRNIQFTFNQTGTSQPVDLFELNFEVLYLDKY